MENYKHITFKEGNPIIVGTDFDPREIVEFGKAEEAVEEFDLNMEIVEECYWFEYNRVSKETYLGGNNND